MLIEAGGFDSGPRLNAVDMSRWGGELTDQEARDMIDQGIELIIVGTGHPNGAGTWSRQQAETWLRNGGKHLHAYIYLYMAGDPKEQVNNALRTMRGLPVDIWWLDAEDTESPELTPAQREEFLRTCITWVNGHTGIYTGRWWWVPNMANSTMFSGMPLWNSWYDGDPDTDGLPYGGWTDSNIEQYEGTTILCGQSVDLNYAKNIEMGYESREDEMTDELRNALEEILSRITKLESVLAGGREGVDFQYQDQGNFMKGLAEIQAKLYKIEKILEG